MLTLETCTPIDFMLLLVLFMDHILLLHCSCSLQLSLKKVEDLHPPQVRVHQYRRYYCIDFELDLCSSVLKHCIHVQLHSATQESLYAQLP